MIDTIHPGGAVGGLVLPLTPSCHGCRFCRSVSRQVRCRQLQQLCGCRHWSRAHLLRRNQVLRASHSLVTRLRSVSCAFLALAWCCMPDQAHQTPHCLLTSAVWMSCVAAACWALRLGFSWHQLQPLQQGTCLRPTHALAWCRCIYWWQQQRPPRLLRHRATIKGAATSARCR